ncbi:MAG: HEAT repeat domain-containing protein [Candidatus Heimdallarchaeaceae archaeon]
MDDSLRYREELFSEESLEKLRVKNKFYEEKSNAKLTSDIDLQRMELQKDFEAKQKKDKSIKRNAVFALRKIGEEQAVVPLIEVLRDEERCVRTAAVTELGKIGEEQILNVLKNGKDEQIIQCLFPMLTDKDRKIREYIAWLLCKLDDEQAIKFLMELLENELKIISKLSLRRIVQAYIGYNSNAKNFILEMESCIYRLGGGDPYFYDGLSDLTARAIESPSLSINTELLYDILRLGLWIGLLGGQLAEKYLNGKWWTSRTKNKKQRYC